MSVPVVSDWRMLQMLINSEEHSRSGYPDEGRKIEMNKNIKNMKASLNVGCEHQFTATAY